MSETTDSIVILSLPLRYLVIMVSRRGSVSLSSIHLESAPTDLSNVITLAGSSHLVTCVEVSPGLLQLGHLSTTSLTQCALAEVQPHIPDTCFVTQLRKVEEIFSLPVHSLPSIWCHIPPMVSWIPCASCWQIGTCTFFYFATWTGFQPSIRLPFVLFPCQSL